MRRQIWQRVTGNCVTVTGYRGESELLIPLHCARKCGSAAEPGTDHRGDRGAPGDRPEPFGGGAQSVILVGGQIDVGRGDVALQLLDAGHTRDRGHRGDALG